MCNKVTVPSSNYCCSRQTNKDKHRQYAKSRPLWTTWNAWDDKDDINDKNDNEISNVATTEVKSEQPSPIVFDLLRVEHPSGRQLNLLLFSLR